jgi:hypothetical protein
MELVRSFVSIVSGLPCEKVRSAPAIIVSGPAQRSLTLWPARSPSRLATLYTESSDSFVASAAVSIVTGWSEPVPGRELHPLESSAFHGALLRQLSGQSSIAWRVAAPRYRGIVAPTTQLVGRLGSGVRSTKSALSSRLRRTVSSRSSSDTGKIL